MALPVSLAPTAAADDVQSQQWYLSAMKADEMWKVSTGKGVKVAVIDTGVNPATPSLKGQVLVNEVPKSVAYGATTDYTGHGTSMAETIAGTGAGGGLKGLAPGAKIVPYRIALKELKDKAEKKKAPDLTKVLKAAADSDAKIISMSFGGNISYDDVEAAIKYADSKGKLMFAGSGNEAETTNKPLYPASYPHVVGVAAADKTGKVGKFSVHGFSVDLAAPGVHVPLWCDDTFRSYCPGYGTSTATAVTSASAALIWSAHPDWTADQVLRSLIDTAGRDWPKDTPSNYLGYGLIRPRKVLENPHYDPGPAHVDPLAKENSAGNPGASSSTSATASASPVKSASSGGTSATASPSKSSDDTLLWVGVGAAAALVLVGGTAFAVIRSRRSA